MEQIDLYKDEFVKTGEICPRGRHREGNASMLVVFSCIFNAKGEMLIQKRADCKKERPGLFDVSAGGAVQAGEKSIGAIQREIREETGLKIPQEDLVKVLSVYYDGMITDIYTAVADPSPEELVPDPLEVSELRFASEEEIYELIRNGAFVPLHKEIIGLLFRMKTQKGILLL